jgi:hypothetical protein
MSAVRSKLPADCLVTDHAVVRYIERVLGVDLELAREAILADGRAEAIRAIGRGRIRIANSEAVLEVMDGRVVTVKTRKGQPR